MHHVDVRSPSPTIGQDVPTTHELVVFAAAVRASGFEPAAKDLGLSQAAVRKVVQRLEGRLGRKLVEPGAGLDFKPTPAGRELAEQAASIVASLEQVVGHTLKPDLTTVQVACAPIHLAVVLAAARAQFEGEHPEFRVELRQVPHDPSKAAGILYEMLRRGEVDFAMGGPHQAGLNSVPVYEAPLIVIPPLSEQDVDGEGKHGSTISVDDLAGKPLVVPTRNFFARLRLDDLNRPLHIIDESRAAAGLISYAICDLAWAVMSEDGLLHLDPSIRGLVLTNQEVPVSTPVHLHWKGKKPSGAARAFLSTVEKMTIDAADQAGIPRPRAFLNMCRKWHGGPSRDSPNA